MVLCEPIQKDGNYKTFGEVVQKLVETIGMYNDCRARHSGLVDYETKKDTK